MREAGLSRGKQRSLRDLAQKCSDGTIPLRRLGNLEDTAVIEALTTVHGIGVWTAEMFLIFSLGRLDILPIGDYGLRAGVQKHYALPDLPRKDLLHELTESWRPYRTIGTWYIWRSLGGVPQSE
jgi:DNA-3-methyladenine glycosylase II